MAIRRQLSRAIQVVRAAAITRQLLHPRLPAPAPAPTPAPEPEPEPDVWHSPWEGTGNYNYAIGRGCDVYGADNYASLCSVWGSDRVSIGDPETGAGLSIWVLTDPDNGIWTRGGY